jgi:rod shape determining protein RodA
MDKMLQKWLKQTHWPLVFSVLLLFSVGTLFVYSAAFHDSGHYLTKHFFWVFVGMMVLFAVPFLGYRTFLNVSYLLYAVSLILLVAVMFFGKSRLGAQRWLDIGPLAIQPSEFAKLATILALANFLGSNHAWEKKGGVILSALVMAGVPCLLIMRQPDLGSAMMLLSMSMALLFLWGISWKIMAAAATSGLIAAPFFWEMLKPYQKKRIMVFLNPNLDPLGSGYTAVQSKIAVGSGGLLGKGYLAGTQSQLQFVPEHHTDFIFCVVGEEWGFAGALLLLCLYGLLFNSAFQVMENTTDIKAKLLVGGVVAVIFTQMFVNIGMTFGLLPITGITLPLVSYGGSSFVATAIALGLILSVYKERSIF